MMGVGRWSRTLIVVGLAAMAIAGVDPLEGSIVVVAGIALVAVGTPPDSRWRVLVYWSLALVAAGVAALWGLSARGGFGGTSGRSNLWGLALLPYPIGWIMGIVSAVQILRERAR